MKILEEKGLREKIINECIKKENELKEVAETWYESAEKSGDIRTKIDDYLIVDKRMFAIAQISDLRAILMQLLDSEKVE